MKHRGEVLLHRGPIMQGPVSSALLLRHESSGDGDCQEPVSFRAGRVGDIPCRARLDVLHLPG